MAENFNIILVVIAVVFVVISIFIKLRYSLLAFLIIPILLSAVMSNGGQASGWYILIFIMHFLKPCLFVLVVIIAIQVLKVSWLDSRELEKRDRK
jgi:hypothetical protein